MADNANNFLSKQSISLEDMPSAADILALPRLRTDVTGIYFLFKDDECVYVGKSRRVHLRVAEHMRRDFRFKDFNTYSWLACSEADASSLEAYYISLLRPRLNIVWSGIPHQRGPRKQADFTPVLVDGIDLDAEITKAKETGQCSRNIKKLVKTRMKENLNNTNRLQ